MSISSPYNFIPLSDTVHIPAWQEVSQDIPLQDGVSGTFEIEIITKSPTIVGDEKQNGEVNFFTTPDGKPAIPGSSIKGVIRNIVETITNARLTQIDDTKISYRDFNSTYTREFVATVGNNVYKTKTYAGWLKLENGEWTLKETNLFRIENANIRNAYKAITKLTKEAEKVYKEIGGIQDVSFNAQHSVKRHQQEYQEAIDLNDNNAGNQGCLIITGQAGKKKMNFVFQKPQDEVSFLNDKVMLDFLSIATKKDPQNTSNIYQYLTNLRHKYGIPVFFLKDDDGKAKALGLTQMFRLTHKQSVGDLVLNSHNNTELDFAELLFGNINNDASIKGRVNIGLSIVTNSDYIPSRKTKILASPKPSFYPTYINQKSPIPRRRHNNYDTEDAKIAGRKQYLIHNMANNEDADESSITSTLNVLENATFTGKVRYHNLKPEELGALIFAFTLGEENIENSNYYHAIGMGKPYGFGKVQIKINLPQCECVNHLKRFYVYAFNTLRNRDTLALVKAMHRCVTNAESLKYPLLNNPKDGSNDFRNIKNLGPLQKLPTINSDIEKKKLENIRREIISGLGDGTNNPEPPTEYESEAQKLIQDTLGGSLDKAALTKLKENPGLYGNLSPDDKKYLVKKIEEYFNFVGMSSKKKKQWRKKLSGIFNN